MTSPTAIFALSAGPPGSICWMTAPFSPAI
jgi:hypothetical protein